MPEQVDGDEGGDDDPGEGEVCCHHTPCLTRQGDDGRNSCEIVADSDSVGGFQCEVRAVAPHRHAEVRGGERGCIVDTVTDNQDRSAVGLECSDDVDLFVR